MTMRYSCSSINSSILDVYGETVIVKANGLENPVTGVYSGPEETASFSGLEIAQVMPSVAFASDTFDDIMAGVDDEVYVRGSWHIIAAPPMADDGGMTMCLLRKP